MPYKNPEDAKARRRAYYQENREAILAKVKADRAKKVDQYKEYEEKRYARDREKRKELAKKYLKVSYQRHKKVKNSMRPLDTIFSLYIRKRDGRCLRCGTTQNLQCSHVIPRTYLSIRWEPENAVALCYACHIHWWHKYPHEAAEWFNNLFPGRYEKLRSIGNSNIKVDRAEVLLNLHNIYNNLQTDWITD